MLQALKKLFRKVPAEAPACQASPDPAAPKSGYGGPPLSKGARISPAGGDPVGPIEKRDAPTVAPVETAALSLRVLLEAFPEGLQATIAKMPAPEVQIALPVSSILKQLPEGVVKMSLTSIHRQAPAGTFHPVRAEEKRMVTVPLAEVFRSFRLDLLRRRPDRRMHEFAGKIELDLFAKAARSTVEPPVLPTRAPLADSPLGREMPVALVFEPKNPGAFPDRFPQTPQQPAAPPRFIVPPPGLGGLPLGVPSAEAPGFSGGLASDPVRELEWPLEVLIETWPDPVRTSLLERAAEGARVSLPAAQIREGLAKGRVTVTWGEIRQLIRPGPVELPSVSEGVELVLPLHVVASAFLKEAAPKKNVPEPEMPSLFSGAPVSRDLAPAPEAAPAPPEFKLRMPDVLRAEPGEGSVAGSVPMTLAPKPSLPRTLGAFFGEPDRAEWSPGEIVEHLARLPAVAGALVALEEGLVVAHSLPEPMKGEVVAAVLPQIFSRIHGYTRDMGLAEVEHLQMATKEGDFQVFRLGFVFFAVLTKKGAVLPVQDLQLLCEELTRQTREEPVAPAPS